MEGVSFLVAFVTGILSFLSPCVLPLVPVYASYITGASVEEIMEKRIGKGKILYHSSLFILGFTSVFVSMGAFSGLIGSFIVKNIDFLSKLAGILVILLGLHQTDTIKILNLYAEKRFDFKNSSSILGSFFVGLSFAAGWSPCLGPIVGSLLLIAGATGKISTGVVLLAAFSAGIAIPFMLISLCINRYFGKRNILSQNLERLKLYSGVLMILIGVLMVAGVYQKVASLFLFNL